MSQGHTLKPLSSPPTSAIFICSKILRPSRLFFYRAPVPGFPPFYILVRLPSQRPSRPGTSPSQAHHLLKQPHYQDGSSCTDATSHDVLRRSIYWVCFGWHHRLRPFRQTLSCQPVRGIGSSLKDCRQATTSAAPWGNAANVALLTSVKGQSGNSSEKLSSNSTLS